MMLEFIEKLRLDQLVRHLDEIALRSGALDLLHDLSALTEPRG